MEQIKDKTFSNQEVPLDECHYIDCNFQSCTFVYSGSGVFGLEGNCISSDCNFTFTGKAADTVAAMRAIYSMGEWGRNTIIDTFQEIAPDIKNLH